MSRMQPLDVLASFHTWLHERRVYRGIAECGVAALLLWVGVNALPTPSPPLLWTPDELPALPAEADNGWVEIGEVPTAAQVPDALAPLFELEPPLAADAFWRHAKTERAPLQRWLEAHAEVLARVELARERPSFADDCGRAGPCTTYDWRLAHDLALGRVVELALAGEARAAEALLDDLLRMNQAQLESAPTVLSVLVALANTRRAMVLSTQLAAFDGSGSSIRVRERVASFDARAYDLLHLVQTRYQVAQKMVHGELPSRYALDEASFLTFDRGLTLRGLNERLAHAHARAAVGDLAGACGAGQGRLEDQPLSWLHNPLGDRFLDGLDLGGFCESIDEAVAKLEATQAASIELLAARKPPSPSRCKQPQVRP